MLLKGYCITSCRHLGSASAKPSNANQHTATHAVKALFLKFDRLGVHNLGRAIEVMKDGMQDAVEGPQQDAACQVHVMQELTTAKAD